MDDSVYEPVIVFNDGIVTGTYSYNQPANPNSEPPSDGTMVFDSFIVREDGTVVGAAEDDEGSYTVNGKVTTASNDGTDGVGISFTKAYAGKHSIECNGTVEDSEVPGGYDTNGQWNQGEAWNGNVTLTCRLTSDEQLRRDCRTCEEVLTQCVIQ